MALLSAELEELRAERTMAIAENDTQRGKLQEQVPQKANVILNA